MRQLKKIIYKIRIKLLYLTNTINALFISKKNSVYIVSSKKYRNKIKEDLCLQKQFLKSKVYSKIVAWEDNEAAEINLIRTVWGYHLDSDKFLKYIDAHNTLNSKIIIKNNIDKKNQYELLVKNKINTIDTKFIKNVNEIKEIDKKYVIKPIVSASGDNTFVVAKKEELSNLKNLKNLIVQPYIEGIKDGEISVIVIDKKIEYGIKRYPGIFTEVKKNEYIKLDNLPSEIIDITKKIINIPEYQEAVIMRVDFVNENNDYKIMEVELIDPQLFIETIPSKILRNSVYKDIVNAILKK